MRLADLRGRGAYAGYPDRHQCIFIHIPKTAGSSVAGCLFGTNPHHTPSRQYQRANPRKYRRYFKFSFVRNPWDRLVSGYCYLRQGGHRIGSEHNIANYGDFGSFVRGWLTEKNVWSSVVFKPQHYFICDADLRLQMDFVGRMENIDIDFRTVCERLNVCAKLTRNNSSDHAYYTEYYTADLRERVASVYADDIRTFGYEFNSRPNSRVS